MSSAFQSLGFCPADILLPAPHVDLSRWAVVACDQYTSDPAYWNRVERFVGGSPSTLHLTFPEIHQCEGFGRVPAIQDEMARYLQDGTLVPAVRDGFVLVERTVPSGKRLGLVGCVDLEMYDFERGSASLVRATEGTILERIPPRVRIRAGATLETPHVMLLVDDPKRTVIEPLYQRRKRLTPLYDFDLMEGGGHLHGYRVDDPAQKVQIASALNALRVACGGLLYAVGDGNHSLATARQCWLNLRETLSPEARERHPARYALVELVNLHDEALVFEPIHRVLFGVDEQDVLHSLSRFLIAHGASLERRRAVEGEQALSFACAKGGLSLAVLNAPFSLPVATLQSFLDEYLRARPQTRLDYIHGGDFARGLGRQPGNACFLLEARDKHALFPAVRRDGALPRKTFSMGEASEKRYYMECRAIE